MTTNVLDLAESFGIVADDDEIRAFAAALTRAAREEQIRKCATVGAYAALKACGLDDEGKRKVYNATEAAILTEMWTRTQVDWLRTYSARLVVNGLHPEDVEQWVRSHTG